MIDSLDTVTSTTVAAALDALQLRQQSIAANLANAGSAGYVSQNVSFEAALLQALESDPEGSKSASLGKLGEFRDSLKDGAYTQKAAKTGVEIDLEMVRLNETVIQYQALIQGLGKYGSLARMAISGEVKG